MTQEEASRILKEFGIVYNQKDNMSQLGGMKILFTLISMQQVLKNMGRKGVEKGYVGKDLPESCFQYLLIYFNNRKTFLNGTIRGGSAHSQSDFCGYLQRFLPLFEKRWKTVFRADSGYYKESAFDIFSENDCTFFIKAPTSTKKVTGHGFYIHHSFSKLKLHRNKI